MRQGILIDGRPWKLLVTLKSSDVANCLATRYPRLDLGVGIVVAAFTTAFAAVLLLEL